MHSPAKIHRQRRPAPNGQPLRVVRAAIATAAVGAGAATLLAGAGWALDLIANLAAQVLGLTLLVAAGLLLGRRWGTALVCLVGAAMHLPVLLAPRAAPAAGPGVKVLLFNPGPENTRAALVREGALASGADLIALTEPPPELVRDMPGAPDVLAAYPGVAVRTIDPAQGVSWAILLSRWPLAPLEDGPATHPGVLARLAQRPEAEGGPFAVIAIHPSSPRTRARWEAGNRIVESAGTLAAWLTRRGVPVIVIGDLNSSPTGWRSRRLGALGGVRRAKPLTSLNGTFPRAWPWPFSIAIDDVLVSSGVGVVSWRAGGALQAAGTDHRPVAVELSVGSSLPVSPR